MRIYSNTILSWPQVIHLFQAARLHPGKYYHYYFYKIQRVQPLVLTTNSPLEFLQENCQYYCYDRYHRDNRFEKYGNTCELVNNSNQEILVHIPKAAEANDVIVVQNDIAPGFPSINFKSIFSFPSPVLA